MKPLFKNIMYILIFCLCTANYASASYTYELYGSSSTTSGGGTWGSILKMKLTGINRNKTFSVSVGKQSGSFSSTGWMYLQGDSYGASSSYNLASCKFYAGNSSKILVSGKTLDNMPSSWWRNNKLRVYCRYEAYGGGYAYVGPIYIERRASCSVVLRYEGWEATYDERGNYICKDNCNVDSNQIISHKWKIRNSGTCKASNYRLSHRSGHNGNASYPPFSINAGGVGYVEVKNFRVPSSSGRFKTYFNILPCSGCNRLPDLPGGGLYIENNVKIREYNINAKAGSGGSISPSGNRSVKHGESIRFSIRANSNYKIENVKVDGRSKGAISTYTFSNVTSNHTIEVIFKHVDLKITTKIYGNGRISPSGTISVPYRSSKTFSISPSSHNKISNVKINGNSKGAISSYTFSNITSNQTIEAFFVPDDHRISATVKGNGRISPSGNVLVSCGSSKTFTISPNSHNKIIDVKVDGRSKGKISSYTFRNVTSNHTIEAIFGPDDHRINSLSSGEGRISPSGNTTVMCGSNKSYSISPSPCHKISDVKIDGRSQGAISSYTFRNIRSNHTIQAYFKPIIYNITSTAERGGNISPKGNMAVKCGENLSFSITPDNGFEINDVLVNGRSVGKRSSFTFSNVNKDKQSILVKFKPIRIKVSINKSGRGDGTLSHKTLYVNYGSNLIVTAKAAVNSIFKGWTGDAQGVGNAIFNNITSEKSITAQFNIKTFRVSINKKGNGEGTVSEKTQTVEYGASLTVKAIPAEDSVFNGWNGDAKGIDAAVLENITSDKNIIAQFDKKTFTVSITQIGNGEGTVSEKTQTVEYGASLTVKAIPAVNSVFNGWNGDAKGIDAAVLENITSDKNIIAQFDKKTFTVSIAKNGSGDGTLSEKTQKVSYGSNIIVKATPAENSTFAGWTGDASGKGNAHLKNIISDKKIIAAFDLKETHPKLTGVEISGINSIEEGKSFQFTAKAKWDDGSTSDINSDIWSISPDTFGTIDQSGVLSTKLVEKDQEITITATYSVDEISLSDSMKVTIKNTLSVSLRLLNKGKGSVIIDNSDHLLPHQKEAEKGETFSIKAKSGEGWKFAFWSGSITDSSAIIDILMDDDKTLTANFVEIPPSVFTFEVSEILGSGKVIVNDVVCSVAPCRYTYTADSDVKIVADPTELFVSWSEDIDSTDSSVSVVLSDNMTVKAKFSEPSASGVALDLNFNTRKYNETVSDQDIESSISASLNDEIWIAVVAQGSKNLDTLQVEVQFDSSKLEFSKGAEDNAFGGISNHLKKNNGETVGFQAIESSPGIVNIANALAGSDDSVAPEGSGIIALLNFKLLSQDLENKLTLQNVVFIDSKGSSTKINQLMNGCINCCPQWDFVRDEDMIVNYKDLGAFADHWLLTEDDEDWDERFNLSRIPDPETGKQVINYRDLGVFADYWLKPSPCSN
ncbi:conserved hypothetical protein, secreted [Candidatus Magnetomorum sp. HK-1]|nr:conserved hypothetical protein, secreted [Candidatus Magnetomorum sp. HK-1]